MEAARRKRRVLVIGLGNPLSGDDGFGPRVIQRLRERNPVFLQRADLVDAHTDLLAHIDRFLHYDHVVILDAVLDPDGKLGSLGNVTVLEEDQLRSLPSTSPGAHHISPLVAVRLFRRLYPQARARISVVAMCTDGISLGLDAAQRGGHLTEDAVEAGAEKVRELAGA